MKGALSAVTIVPCCSLIGARRVQLLAASSFIASMAYVLADVTADAVLVERSKLEASDTHGSMQATGYIIQYVGRCGISMVASRASSVGIDGQRGPRISPTQAWPFFILLYASFPIPILGASWSSILLQMNRVLVEFGARSDHPCKVRYLGWARLRSVCVLH